jgi:poly(beta-D-mannuronate) lyase
MKRLLLLTSLLAMYMAGSATTIIVKDITELAAANKQAKPGDTIVLRSGEWNNVTIQLDCSGTKEQPVVFKAETAGKVLITGHSQLRVGGSYILVEGLYFINGYAGDEPVIGFRTGKKQVANSCRVTNCVVDNFNNPKRMDENNWVLFYGKNNRLDHCSFRDKKNMGVLLAVILDDDRSRENFHSIDHNYFGRRPPLGSNGGEIIRVGVSQHCQFNSNTQITNNFFEDCDGETEIVSVKSGSNSVRNNLFKECQGSVVLRHGDNNTVENNIFLGNDKEATGGVRVINKGQWIVNNLFYKCRGVDFRSPLAIMNGIPNSPAFRYVQVTDAVIANNSFYNCSPATFCEGSDTERTLPPQNVFLLNNTFYNTRDSIIYKAYDNTSGFVFHGNTISEALRQDVTSGFRKTGLIARSVNTIAVVLPATSFTYTIPDSIQQAAGQRLGHRLSEKPYFSDQSLVKKIQANAINDCGAGWFKKTTAVKPTVAIRVSCKNAAEVYRQLERKEPVIITLTGKDYILTHSLVIGKSVRITGNPGSTVNIITPELFSVFNIAGKGNLVLENLNIDGRAVQAANFISSDTAGSSDHYNFSVLRCTVSNLTQALSLFHAAKSMIADSIVIRNSFFINNHANGLLMNEEKDDKGYYNAEKIIIANNRFDGQQGVLLDIYRGGNDESTLGPKLSFTNNNVINCNPPGTVGLITLMGVQHSRVAGNRFSGCAPSGVLIEYKDVVRANHLLSDNHIVSSGTVQANKFVSIRSSQP